MIDITSPEIGKSVDWALRHWHVRPADQPDARQSVLLALWRAVPRYDGERGASFRTFCAYRAAGAVRDWLRFHDGDVRTKKRCHGAIVMLPGADRLARDPSPGPDRRAIARATLARLMDGLSAQEKRVVEERFLVGFALDEVADALSISKSRVSAIQRSALDKLKARAQAA